MNHNQELITTFYTAFQRKDHAGMIACYHPNIHFSDPVFTDLHGNQAKAMWHMLCERGKDLEIVFSDVVATASADEGNGRAHWEATYTFSTGRKVHNIIDAAFEFQDGLIVRHQDSFDLWRWTRMALGPMGWFLGWSSVVQNRVRETALAGLDKFVSTRSEYQ
jgi:ketosteroid isomerase-like protein